LSHSFYFHVRDLSFAARLASHHAICSEKVIPCCLLRTHPRPYNMSAACIKKGRNRHNQAETSPSGLTQGLVTPSLLGTRMESVRQFTLRARILRTQVSTSVSANSAEKGQSRQLGPQYLHIVTSQHRSGWTRWLMKVQRSSTPVNPSQSRLWRMSCTGCTL
jgi:hypothetical protein